MSILKKLPGKRVYLMDSGASYHVVKTSDLSPEEKRTRREVVNGPKLRTANGRITPRTVVDLYLEELGITVEACVLNKKIPTILSVGKLVRENGCSYSWTPEDGARISLEQNVVECEVNNDTPLMTAFDESEAEEEPCSPAASDNSQEDSLNFPESPDVIQSSSSSYGSPLPKKARRVSQALMSSPMELVSDGEESDLGELAEVIQNLSLSPPESLVCPATEEPEAPSSPSASSSAAPAPAPSTQGEVSVPSETADRQAVQDVISDRARQKHNVFTHFPKSTSCEVCRLCKTYRAQCRQKKNSKKEPSLPAPEKFADQITIDFVSMRDFGTVRHSYQWCLVIYDKFTHFP